MSTPDTIELSPADAGDSRGAFLDQEIGGVNRRLLDKLENGERAAFKPLSWSEKLRRAQAYLHQQLRGEQKAVSSGNAEQWRVEFVENQLAYATSLNVAARLAKLVRTVHEREQPERMHLPLTEADHISRKIGIYVVSHACELGREAVSDATEEGEPWSFEEAEASFDRIVGQLKPDEDLAVATIGDVQISVRSVEGPDHQLNGINVWLARLAVEPETGSTPGAIAATA